MKRTLGWGICWMIVFAFGMALSVHLFGMVRVTGQSMESSIGEGDRLLVYKKGKAKSGDVILMKTREGRTIVKRVIATEGDVVSIKDHKLYVNGVEQKEAYLKGRMQTAAYPETPVTNDQVFLLGDNRDVSVDSRLYGTYSLGGYRGKVLWNVH